MSPKTRWYIQRIIPFGLIFLFSGSMFTFIELAMAGGPDNLPEETVPLDLKIFVFASFSLTVVGLLVGVIELVYLENRFSKNSFAQKILFKLIFYLLLFSLIILITFNIAESIAQEIYVFNIKIWRKYLDFLTSIPHLSTIVQLAISLILSLLYAEISQTVGHKVLLNFFTGKYHKPIEEDRIFMFLDMKSSTTIAEVLGHTVYFKLLKAYYDDLSDAIIQHGGEIYQYVGDEIIVSWKVKNARENNHAVNCFFNMKKDLQKKESWYEKTFGRVPRFKAGLHYGKVTSGEIGAIKKEIFFTGDVLNATARIQGLCNQFNVDFILSAKMLAILNLEKDYEVKRLGEMELRGKKEKVELYTIAPKDQ